MHLLYTIDEIRKIENAALAALPTGVLMQRAGRAAADLAHQLLPDDKKDARVLVIVGPGNNGGDALETASMLSNEKVRVSVLLITGRQTPSEEASMARKHAINSNIEWEDPLSINNALQSISSKNWALVIDGMFGTGLKEPLDGSRLKIAEFINTLSCPVLALDVPSGLNANTGNIVGKEGTAVHATHTITFIGDKPGLHTAEGRDYAGEIHVNNLDIEKKHFLPSSSWLNHVSLFSPCLRKRLHNSHKGTYGEVAIVGGAEGMAGAPILSARIATQCGAGLCYAVYPKNPPDYDGMQPELMLRAAHRFDFSSAIVAAGPGLGQSNTAHDILVQVLNSNNNPLILDADALNLIAKDSELQQQVMYRTAPTLLTPHPLEAGRLLGISSQSVQMNRLQAARELTAKFNTTVILKGSGSIIASPDGKLVVNPTGNPALATAGSGDMLTGICAALLSQGWPVWEAALAGVWMHGSAADELIKQGIGPIGLTSSELIPAVRFTLNRLIAEFG